MTTYSDMVTLLLAFFVLLFSMSSVDLQKFQAVMSSIQGNLGVLDGGLSISSDDYGFHTASSDAAIEQLIQLQGQLQEHIEERGLESSIHLEFEERGLIVRFADQVFFDLGQSDIKNEAHEILHNISPMLRDLPNPIRVEGHTDNLPINTTRFPSNWELSTARATSVIRYLVEEEGFDPLSLSAAGYGEYRPIVDNETPDNRALNRRVDIIIMSMDLWLGEPL